MASSQVFAVAPLVIEDDPSDGEISPCSPWPIDDEYLFADHLVCSHAKIYSSFSAFMDHDWFSESEGYVGCSDPEGCRTEGICSCNWFKPKPMVPDPKTVTEATLEWMLRWHEYGTWNYRDIRSWLKGKRREREAQARSKRDAMEATRAKLRSSKRHKL